MFFIEDLWRYPERKQEKEPPTSSASAVNVEDAISLRSSSPDESILEERPKVSSKELGKGENSAEFLQLQDDGSAIFKAQSNEVRLRESIPRGSYYKRERAAYLVDKFLRFGLVPPTVIREVDGEIGSMQRFISNGSTILELPQEKINQDETQEHLARLWVFDYIIYNSDRHNSNFLIGDDKKVHAIDNGLAFGYDSLRRLYDRFIKNETRLSAPTAIKESIDRFVAWPEGQTILRELLAELLPSDEIDACFNRISYVAALLQENQDLPMCEEYAPS
jgi:hypothetical protein